MGKQLFLYVAQCLNLMYTFILSFMMIFQYSKGLLIYIFLKINQRDITPKLSTGEQSFLYTCCHNLIHIAIKFHHDIPKPYIVIEFNRIALQTVIVYFFSNGCNSVKNRA